MFKLKPLVGTVSQWKKIFTGVEFMGEDQNKKWRYIPRPEIDTGRSKIRKLLDYLKIVWWLKFPPKEPKMIFERFD